MPGDPEVSAQWRVPDNVMTERIRASAFIRDGAGNRWRIRPDGRHDLLGPEEWPPHVW